MNRSWFASLADARRQLETWRIDLSDSSAAVGSWSITRRDPKTIWNELEWELFDYEEDPFNC